MAKKATKRAVPTPTASSAGTPLVPTKYKASIYADVDELPVEFSDAILAIQGALGVPVWLLVQNAPESPVLEK